MASPLFAFELFFEVRNGEAQGGGAAVGAIAAALDLFLSGQQRLDFIGGERVAGLHRGFATGHVEDFVEEFLRGEFASARAAVFHEAIEQVFQEFTRRDFGKQARKTVHRDAAGIKVFNLDAELEQQRLDGFKRRSLRGLIGSTSGMSRRWPSSTPRVARAKSSS